MTQKYDPQTDDILARNILPSIYGVRLGRQQAFKDVWEAAKKAVRISNQGAVIRLEDLYRILFKEAGE